MDMRGDVTEESLHTVCSGSTSVMQNTVRSEFPISVCSKTYNSNAAVFGDNNRSRTPSLNIDSRTDDG